jgi:large subunit ribosomal protein L16
MLMPKRVRWRKQHKTPYEGKAQRGSEVFYGEYGLQSLEGAWITDRQIEAARVALTRSIRRGGKVWIRIFPDKPMTKKPAETRMGSGKGNPESWVAVVKPGRILFEIAGVSEADAREALRLAGTKLPIHTRFRMRQGAQGEAQDKAVNKDEGAGD